MSNVKIILGKNETIEDVDAALYKALDHHVSGDVHTEAFDDPAMVDISEKVLVQHQDLYDEMISEIIQELEKEYTK